MRCINLRPGFRCEPCPPGYTGNAPEGIGLEAAIRNKQICSDIDECAYGNGGCKGPCINTPVITMSDVYFFQISVHLSLMFGSIYLIGLVRVPNLPYGLFVEYFSYNGDQSCSLSYHQNRATIQ